MGILAGDFRRVEPEFSRLAIRPGADFSIIRERQGFIAIRNAIHTKDAERAREYIQRLRPYVEDFQREHSQLILEIYKVLTEYLDEKITSFEELTHLVQTAAEREEIRPFLDMGEPMKKLLKQYIASVDAQQPVKEFAQLLLNELHGQNSSHTVPKFKQDLIEPLTEREQEVLSHLLERKTYQEIANSMFVSVNTVKTHLKNLYAKLSVGSKSEAVEKAKSMGFLDD